ncbi:class I SAM-dependent methyltransferase (plasmid) [Haloferacaceae archaeon DSL9]
MDSNRVRNEWADRTGEYSPAYYAYYGPNEVSALVREIFDRHLGRDAAILELGCSVGRHLAHLAEHGFENLAGVDINEEAFEVMADQYPALAGEGTFYRGSIESTVGDFDDGQFDAVFAIETLQHLHEDGERTYAEIARITDDVLLTAEIEQPVDGSTSDTAVNYVDDGLPLYYRDWNRIFTGLGFDEVAARQTDRDVVRTFRIP